MPFERLAFEREWTNSEHFDRYVDSEAQVRADLQYHPDKIKEFLNQVLLSAMEASSASGTLGAVDGDGRDTNIQAILNAHLSHLRQLDEDVETLASGGVPSVSRCTPVDFKETDWVTAGDRYRLTIPQSMHRRTSAAFGYNLWEKVGSTLDDSTWNVVGTTVRYETGNGDIVLEAEEAYAGSATFFGV